MWPFSVSFMNQVASGTEGETSLSLSNLKHAHTTRFENSGASHTTGYY